VNESEQVEMAALDAEDAAWAGGDREDGVAAAVAAMGRQLAVLERVLAVAGAGVARVQTQGGAAAPAAGQRRSGPGDAPAVQVERVVAERRMFVAMPPVEIAPAAAPADVPEAVRRATPETTVTPARPVASVAPVAGASVARAPDAGVKGGGLRAPVLRAGARDYAAFAPAMARGEAPAGEWAPAAAARAAVSIVAAVPAGLPPDGSAAPGEIATSAPGGGTAPASWPSVAPPPAQDGGRPAQGDVFLDGMRMGRWMTDHLARQAGRAPAGGSGFDPRMGIAWPGTQQGN
jgi:hypothetical protein